MLLLMADTCNMLPDAFKPRNGFRAASSGKQISRNVFLAFTRWPSRITQDPCQVAEPFLPSFRKPSLLPSSEQLRNKTGPIGGRHCDFDLQMSARAEMKKTSRRCPATHELSSRRGTSSRSSVPFPWGKKKSYHQSQWHCFICI